MTAGIDLAAEAVGMVEQDVIAQPMGQPQAVAAFRASAQHNRTPRSPSATAPQDLCRRPEFTDIDLRRETPGPGLESATITGNSGSGRLGVLTRPSSTSTSLAMIDEMRARRWLRLARRESQFNLSPHRSTAPHLQDLMRRDSS
jgi:hypothetical protein